MTCCIGKARIYYKEPIGFGNINAPEPLRTECVEIPSEGKVAGQRYSVRAGNESSWRYGTNVGASFHDLGTFIGPLSFVTYSEMSTSLPGSGSGLDTWFAIISQQSGTTTRPVIYDNTPFNQSNASGYPKIDSVEFLITPLDGLPEPPSVWTYKIIGEITGTEYVNIEGLDECPAVENLGCVMGEERYIDVDMGIGLPLLPSMIPDCLIAFSGFPLPQNTIQIRKIRVTAPNTKPGKVKLPQAVLTITGLDGCPAEYSIECFPNGSTDPRERCPPDTDCSLDCGSFICCYKNGKVIRTVRK